MGKETDLEKVVEEGKLRIPFTGQEKLWDPRWKTRLGQKNKEPKFFPWC